VRLDQPYRGYALDLLTPQKYPIDKAPYEPYDVVAWALPFSFGVDVKAIEDEAVKQVPVDAVAAPVSYAGAISGEGGVYLLRDRGQESLLAARARLAGFTVVAEKAFTAAAHRAGSWIVRDQPPPGAGEGGRRAGPRRGGHGRRARRARHVLDPPRLAVLQTWGDTESPGWVDDPGRRKVPYTLIMDEDVRVAARDRFDVILFPNTSDGQKDIVGGIDRGSDRWPTHAPGSPPTAHPRRPT
jgi:hypothetical protein